MTSWVDRFRASVSWGDQLTAALLPCGTACCSMPMNDGLHFWVPGHLADLSGAVASARQALQSPGCSGVTVLFMDRQATAAQVEESLHLVASSGAGCDFLESQPRVLRDGLLSLMSEGTILDNLPPSAD